MFYIATLLLTLGLTAAAHGQINPKRSIIIQGEIAGQRILALGDRLEQLANESKEPIDIAINSPGGSVIVGFLFVNRMESVRSRGIKLRCYVQDIAASMAFQMLMHCDERNVLERSFLLWHRVRVVVGGMFGSPMTAPQAATLARDLQAIDDLIIEELHTSMLDITFDDIMYHLENETLHTGINLARMAPKAFKAHKVIPGLYELLNSQEAKRQAAQAEGIRQGEIVYRTTKVQ
jgi:ATP-dependent protease ClpP protease subunit